MASQSSDNGKIPQNVDVDVFEDEELQDLLHGKLVILQKKDGYRFSVDPILLSSFVEVKNGDKVIDLGTGSGIIPLIIAHREQETTVDFTGLELQESMSDMAKRSVVANKLNKEITIMQGDIRTVKESFKPDSFDVVISNPPYIPIGKGQINPDDSKAQSRHELNGTLTDVIKAARYLAKPKGRVYFIYPVIRLVDMISECRQNNLEPRRLQFVHANQASSAKLAMVEAIRDAGVDLKVIRPMIVYNMDGTYSEEVASILNEEDNTLR